jgi:D-inositol-3-phosphate glycosyltransferase
MLSYHTCPLATLGGKDTGGMNVYVRELTRTFGKIGVKVDVFTRSQDEHVPHVVHQLGYGNRVVHIPAGPEMPLPKEVLATYIDEFSNKVIEFANEKGIEYDLIHSHYWMSGVAAIELKKIWNIPFVHMFHTLGLMKNRIAGNGEFEGEYRIKGELAVIRNADKIIAATEAEMAQLQWLYEVPTRKIAITPPGVNVGRFYPIPVDEARSYLELPDKPFTILFVGRIEPLKGIETLIRAIGILLKKQGVQEKEISLMIIGGDAFASQGEMSNEMNRLQELRRELGLSDFVNFLGKQDQDKLSYFYSAADVVVVPSHYESFGMVALEAMACGTPVIASQVGGLAFLVKDGETGYHIQDQNPDLLCDRIHTLIEDEPLKLTMGNNAEKEAQRYTWRKIAERILEVYKLFVEKR